MLRNVGFDRIVNFIVSSGRGIFLCTKWRQCHACQDHNVKYLYEEHHKENYGLLTVWYRMEKFCELKSAFKNQKEVFYNINTLLNL